MKALVALLSLSLAALVLPACRTARWAAHGVADESLHAVEKTTHAVGHGVRKAERHF